jgi:large-conductance mechanosensitive channel
MDVINFLASGIIFFLCVVLFIFFIVRVVKLASRTVDRQQAVKAARPAAPPVHRCTGARFCIVCGYPMGKQY